MDDSGAPAENRGNSGKANGKGWTEERVREWRSLLAIAVAGFCVFTALSGLSIWLLPFNVANQVTVLLHTLAGLAFLLPCGWYLVRHWLRYWKNPVSHIQLLGYIGAGALVASLVSGLILTCQSAFGIKINYAWDLVHIVTTFATLAFLLPHIILIVLRDRKAREAGSPVGVPEMAGHYGKGALVFTLGCGALVALVTYAYSPGRLQNDFPAEYSFKYGKERPFAPSLARTASGRAMDSRLLSGSRSCGTSGCHEQIVKEWESSAHRYAAMVEFDATDDQGKLVFSSGALNPKGFISPGAFMFKAEPVDQYGNLIDRHNLWEMVGVRYRRSLFPGFSDTAEYDFFCPQMAPVRARRFPQETSYHIEAPRDGTRILKVQAHLYYRKMDQFLLNFMFGEKKCLTAPVTEMASQSRTIEIATPTRERLGK
jgi:hypothetical protein